MTLATSVQVKEMSPAERRAYAQRLVVNSASKPGSAAAFRNRFSTIKMLELEKSLKVDFQKVIDECMRTGAIHVTNGIVWSK